MDASAKQTPARASHLCKKYQPVVLRSIASIPDGSIVPKQVYVRKVSRCHSQHNHTSPQTLRLPSISRPGTSLAETKLERSTNLMAAELASELYAFKGGRGQVHEVQQKVTEDSRSYTARTPSSGVLSRDFPGSHRLDRVGGSNVDKIISEDVHQDDCNPQDK